MIYLAFVSVLKAVKLDVVVVWWYINSKEN